MPFLVSFVRTLRPPCSTSPQAGPPWALVLETQLASILNPVPCALAQESAAVPAVVREVLESQLASILAGHTLDAFHDVYAAVYSNASLRHRAAAAEAGASLRPQQQSADVRWLLEGEGPIGESPPSQEEGLGPVTEGSCSRV